MTNNCTKNLSHLNKLNYEGSVFESNSFGRFVVLKYESNKNITVQFLDTGFLTRTTLSQIQRGAITDKLSPTLCGVGILGGRFDIKENGIPNREYKIWYSMMNRCYDKTYQRRFPTYRECEVSDYFKCYDNFHVWCNEQKGFKEEFWQLDKDLLITGNKMYGETTCAFLPSVINLAIVKPAKVKELPVGVTLSSDKKKFVARISRYGNNEILGRFLDLESAKEVYKHAKVSYITELANKYRGLIDDRAYEALINYKVYL